MVYTRRRVSYIIPPPVDSVPRLQLPPFGISRLGSTGPLLLSSQIVIQDTEEDLQKRTSSRRPSHRLGVASLAIDTSTHLAGRNAPEGILYTGGRDGMVMSWDLGIPMKRRREKFGFTNDGGSQGDGHRAVGRWEILTGWADDFIDEETEEVDERPGSDGDVLGDVSFNGIRNKWLTSGNHAIPFEDEWETDLDTFKPGNPTQFRQSAQTHTDWVNDLLLCNYNQTVVSASSDGTIKAWNPHSPSPSDPSMIGSHNDYVRCLTHCRERNWLASGSFDRTIKLWDLSRATTQPSAPLMTLSPPDSTTPKSSVYALAADSFGHTIASGSPERVIRLWDPRSGRRTGKLVGHTDNIRAILISEDSRYLLTGSTDASIKLWSISSTRCLHTFTHHTDSVWSLFSSHPSLEIFYSGDKSGLVCRVDVENCADVSEGECMLLCQDSGGRSKASSEGVNRIVAMDDNLLWTASSSSSILRWRVPQRRSVRAAAFTLDGESERLAVSESPVVTMFKRHMTGALEGSTPPRSIRESITRPSTSASHRPPHDSFSMIPPGSLQGREDDTTVFGIPFHSLIKLTSPNDPFTPYSFAKGRDAEVATLYSAASIMSVPRAPPAAKSQHGFHAPHNGPIKSLRADDTAPQINTARADYEERELAVDAVPFCSAPEDIIEGDHGLVRSVILNDRIHALTVDTSGEVAVWDIVRAVCCGKYTPEEVASASHRGSTSGGSGGDMERSPREALEAVRERIEGEAVVLPWSSVDTKTGVLAIHLNERCFEAEIYADEVGFSHDRQFNDETRLNIGKWILRNIFSGFIREEQRSRRKREPNSGGSSPTTPRRDNYLNHIEVNGKQPKKQSSSSSDISKWSTRSHGVSVVVSSPNMIPAVSPAVSPARASPLFTPMTLHALRKDGITSLTPVLQSPAIIPTNSDTAPVTRPRLQPTETPAYVVPTGPPKDADYFSLQTRPGGVAPTPDDLSGSKSDSNLAGQNVPTPGGGLMGRLKNFGKISSNKKQPETGPSALPAGGLSVPEVPVVPEESLTSGLAPTKTPQHVLLSGPLSFPPATEALSHSLPPNVSVIISEEASPGWTAVYRGTVASVAHDIRILEEVLPMWLLEYLLTNKTPPVPVVKLSFVLLPWPNKDPEGEQLPELLDITQSKLTASRFLRIRKVIVHVQEKLDKLSRNPDRLPGTPRSSSSLDLTSPSGKSSRSRSEDQYEILCNDITLPLDITLAAVRQFVWRQSGELTMYYRRKLAKGTGEP